jgi:molybdopterin molybdotransferase
MISVTEAKEIINNNVTTLAPVKSVLSEADGKVLAEDVYASVDIPAFPQSSDGWLCIFV